MCGRFTLFADKEEIQQEFALDNEIPLFDSRYNIAPSTEVFSIIESGHERRGGFLRWGMIPNWAKEKKIGSKLINARAETVDSKPSFKRSFKEKRCIIPTTGFYEWKRLDDGKQPYFIYPTNESGLFGFAGLWDKWVDEQDNAIYSCTIITTEANTIMEELHHRMPVILDKESYSTWLDTDSDMGQVKGLLRPFDSNGMATRPVSTLVNSPKNDSEKCIGSITR